MFSASFNTKLKYPKFPLLGNALLTIIYLNKKNRFFKVLYLRISYEKLHQICAYAN